MAVAVVVPVAVVVEVTVVTVVEGYFESYLWVNTL
jgi:hypothetical protein